MAVEDLDLEFEEEEKSGGDAVNIDIDLSFSASPEGEIAGAIKGTRVKPTAKKAPIKGAQVHNAGQLKMVEDDDLLTLDLGKNEPAGGPIQNNRPKDNIERAQSAPISNHDRTRTQTRNTQARPAGNPTSPSSGQEVQFLQQQINQLQQQLSFVEENANIKLAVAEAEKNYLVEYMSNAKVLDIQITQILLKMNIKAPALKAESQSIKKLINEFLRKSHPKK
ncbi:MAG: hypothetical protein ACJAS4_002991 [Bacteriovoracaceae bacterium]|jgi:hypothetical protein